MNATFFISQLGPDWSETHVNIGVPPGSLIETFPIHLDHKIDDAYKLFFSIQASMTKYSPSVPPVGNAYAFEEGVDPPE